MKEVTQNSCELGQYFNNFSNQCEQCLQNCARCDQQTQQCLDQAFNFIDAQNNNFNYSLQQIQNPNKREPCLFREDCEDLFQEVTFKTLNCTMFSPYNPQLCQMCKQNYVLNNNFQCKSSQNNNISIYNQIVDGCIKYDEKDQNCITCLTNYLLVDQQPYCSLKACPQGYIKIGDKCFACNQDNCLDQGNCTVDCYCQRGYFYVQQGSEVNQSNCQKCDTMCELCTSNKSQCTACKIIDPQDNQKCIGQCPSGYYQQDKNCISCTKFDSYCSQCTQTECQQCKEGYIKINSKCFLCHQDNCIDSNKCTVDCYCQKGYFYLQQGQFVDKSNCQKCDTMCELCTSNKSQCTVCKIIDPKDETKCIDQCPIEYFQQNKYCIPCTKFDDNCSQCTQIDCQQCKQGFDFINKSCKKQCQSNQFRNSALECQPCHLSCKTCNGSLDTDCTTCINSFSMNEYKICQICDKGYFYNPLSNPQNDNFNPQNCQKCDPQCQECHAQSNICLKCKIIDPINQTNCLAQCPDGYYQQDNICFKCLSNCLLCTQSKCNLCTEGYEVIQNQCILKCQSNQFRDQASLQCKDCHFSCQNCNGPLSKNCTSCIKQLRLSSQGECQICDQGEFYQGNEQKDIQLFKYDYSKCFSCHLSCQECIGPSNAECTSCIGDLLIHPQSKLCVEKALVDQLNNEVQQCSSFQISSQDPNECRAKLDKINFFKKVQQAGSISFLITGSVSSILLSSTSLYFMSSIQNYQILGNYYILAPQISKGEIAVYLQDMYSLNIFNLIKNPFFDSSVSTPPPPQPQQASQRLLFETQDVGQFFIENCFYQCIVLFLSVLVLPILFALDIGIGCITYKFLGVLSLLILCTKLMSNYLQNRKTQKALNSQIQSQAVEQITDARITEFFDSRRILSKQQYFQKIKFS
ncbi:hypothetical protein ABPG72_016481 [Tetrahymena utriculariae]